jgi:hypothetical protein
MALVVYDRVQETTATTGTGTITLSGAVAGYQSFAVVGNGNTTFYCIVNTSAWEVGIGTYTSAGTTLARTTVLSNSNGNTSPITLVGASNVFVCYPASKSINYDANGVATIGTTLSYSDTGIVGSFASTTAGYNQVIVQNKSNATNASSNLNVSNDAATSTTGYAELGINSSTFTGSGSFSIAGASYLASASTDLTIGTYGAYSLHFVTNSNTTDAMTIYNSGGVSLGGYADPGIGTLYANNIYLGFNAITAAAGTTVLTNASAGYQNVTGTTTQTIQLPVATTLYKGLAFTVANASTGAVTIKDSASTTIDTVVTGGTAILVLTNNGTSAGTWVAYSYIPSTYDFNATSANFGNATISSAVWNGTTIASGYGGTGLTTFTAANNALYSTSASALAAGTLPIAAGGTAATTFTANGVLYGNGTSALGVTAAGTTGQVLIGNTGAAPSWGSVPTTAAVTSLNFGTTGLTPASATTGAITVAGTLVAANGGTGQSSYAVGDLLYASTTTALSKLADVATGNALISGGVSTAPSWGKIGLTTHVSGTLPLANGGTNSTTAPQAFSTLMGWTTTATASGTTTLTNTSTYQQEFTGTLTQTVVLPVTSTLALGWSFLIINNSTGALTVQSSGLNTIGTINAGSTASLVCVLTSGTSAASWDFDITGFAAETGTGSVVRATSPTLVTPALGTPSSGTVTNLTGTASININGTVGATTPTTGAFTTLAASSTVSGAGFTTYLASPPAIGGTAAAAGTFTQLTVNGASVNTSISPTGTGTVTISPAGALTINPTAASTINNTSIGATTRSTGAFTTLGANGAVTVQTTTNNQSYTTTGAGTITISSGTAGAIDNMNIGATTAGTGRFTTVTSTVATGTAPFIVASTTQVANLNAATAGTATNQSGGTVAATTISASGVITSTLSTGTAPFTVTSTTPVTNLSIGGNAATVGYQPSRTDATAYPILWGTGTSTTSTYSCAAVTIQSSTGTVNATTFSGAGTGLTGTAASLTAGAATTATNLSGGTVSATTVQATGGFTATSAAPFYLNATTVSSNYTSPANYNLMSAGPITINTGVTVTIDTTGSWVIV